MINCVSWTNGFPASSSIFVFHQPLTTESRLCTWFGHVFCHFSFSLSLLHARLSFHHFCLHFLGRRSFLWLSDHLTLSSFFQTWPIFRSSEHWEFQQFDASHFQRWFILVCVFFFIVDFLSRLVSKWIVLTQCNTDWYLISNVISMTWRRMILRSFFISVCVKQWPNNTNFFDTLIVADDHRHWHKREEDKLKCKIAKKNSCRHK